MANLSFINSPSFDFGVLTEVSDKLRELGVRKPLICTDPGLVRIGLTNRLRDTLSNEFGWEIYDRTPENPTEDAVEEALAQYQRAGCDSVISFGGGSSMDLGKAVAVVAAMGGKVSDYPFGGKEITDKVPMVAIPTTSGTGSEVSNGAVIIMKDGRKLILVGPKVAPDAALCDPELTMGLPSVMTAGAGMDALTHCIEAVLSPLVNPPAEAVGLDGIERSFRKGSLETAVRDGSDRQARWEMMMASTEGAMAFTKGLGPVHSMSHACGAVKGLRLHHGTLNGVILPTILRFNHGHVGDKYQRIARAMGLPENTDLADTIQSLNSRIGLPANLSEMGIRPEMFAGCIEHALADICHLTAPRPPSPDEYHRLFEQASGLP